VADAVLCLRVTAMDNVKQKLDQYEYVIRLQTAEIDKLGSMNRAAAS
jgi:hypothetical protein